MFCTTCGKPNPDDAISCEYCHVALEPVENTNPAIKLASTSIPNPTVNSNERQLSTNIEKREPQIAIGRLLFFTLIGIVIGFMCFAGASQISAGGLEIMGIRSVGGTTLEEAYYQELGSVYQGIALFIRALGVFGAAVMVHFGLVKE